MKVTNVYLIDSVALGESVEDGVHGVEHGDDFHGCDTRTNLSKCHHVREQDRHAVEHLQTRVHNEYLTIIKDNT